MGNCCGCLKNSGGGSSFGGTGHRLGSADENAYGSGGPPSSAAIRRDDDTPAPTHDPNLNDDERARLRADRAKAAEARLKKQTGGTKKKKPNPDAEPLRGPNSQPLMRWTAG
uniref:Uncharacterized protein n=1 Tax=Ditylum brightwellii TaxID=49249 RepID=A0A7S4T8J6_9STRA|mmetsp:Transcript_5989/g.7927  ORF Transcript_5989/g.7927 Transcript_5989/m.7927 type:complete len:112 (+) Transcript_5989:50-385(+)